MTIPLDARCPQWHPDGFQCALPDGHDGPCKAIVTREMLWYPTEKKLPK